MVTKYTHIVGRAGNDVELFTGEGKARAKFRLAVTTGFDSDAKAPETTWYDVTAWEELALSIVGAIKKGMRIWVTGKETVWHADSGDRMQISARDIGHVTPFMIAAIKSSEKVFPSLDGVDESETW